LEIWFWKAILPMDKKSKVIDKWSLNWVEPYVIEKVFSGNAYVIQEVNTNNYVGLINGKYLKTYRPTTMEVSIPIT